MIFFLEFDQTIDFNLYEIILKFHKIWNNK